MIPLLLGLMSCRISSIDNEDAHETAVEEEIIYRQIENEFNAYESVGLTLNAFLEFFAVEYAGQTTIKLDSVSFLSLLEDFYEKENLTFGSEQDYAYTQLFLQLIEVTEIDTGWTKLPDKVCDLFPYLCEMLPENAFSPPPYFFDTLNHPGVTTSTARTFNFITEIRYEESLVMADFEMMADKQKALLSYLASARYSSVFWHNELFMRKADSFYFEMAADIISSCAGCVVYAGAAGAALGSLAPGLDAAPTAAIFSLIAVINDLLVSG